MRQLGRIAMTGFMALQILFGLILMPAVAHAGLTDSGPLNTNSVAPTNLPTYSGVDQSIANYLCVPSDTSVGTALYSCITKLYRFGIAAGAIALVGCVVVAGYFYLAGGEASKAKGKGIFTSALTGVAIILSSYVLLGFVNPELTKIKIIQPPIFTASILPKCADVGLGENCVLPDGQVRVGGGGTPGSANEAQYKDLIAKYATQNGLQYCHLSALISQESSFNRLAYSNPSGTVNVNAGPPAFGLSFNVFHAIGLTQVTIYPKASGGWVGDTPARSDKGDFGTSPLTLEMLLNPETNIAAGATFFGHLFAKDGQDINKAYGHYFNGAGSDAPPPVSLTKKYNDCLLRTK
jgi:hypothetical protein